MLDDYADEHLTTGRSYGDCQTLLKVPAPAIYGSPRIVWYYVRPQESAVEVRCGGFLVLVY